MMDVLDMMVQEDAKLDAMQMQWSAGRRMLTSDVLFQDEAFEDIDTEFTALENLELQKGTSQSCMPQHVPEEEIVPVEELVSQLELNNNLYKQPIVLDASTLNDIPARYVIAPCLEAHQLPVVGVYIDPRVTPGFKYRVRPLPSQYQYFEKDIKELPAMFEDRALVLKSIGRGYARRFTFDDLKTTKIKNVKKEEVCFWSDSRPDGFCFELEVLSAGDKFTVYDDTNHEAQGTLEVLQIENPQLEISSSIICKGVEKRVRLNFTAKLEFYETGVAKPKKFSGCAIVLKRKSDAEAKVMKIVDVCVDGKRQGFYLTPGIQKDKRRVTVKGQDIQDVPTKYTMTGLEPYEIPVVGTYVDPRIIPGFYYRVRPNDRRDHLFNGRALRLESIGMGYAKRLTFQPDTLTAPNNYLWSDNHPDGLGLEPRALHPGMKFTIKAGHRQLGQATVFRADMPQVEEKMEKTSDGTIIKYIHVDVMCHVKLAHIGGKTDEEENEVLLRVYGLAVVEKRKGAKEAKVVRVEKISLDSQLNLIFARSHVALTFQPFVRRY